jgi:hypothetical protein
VLRPNKGSIAEVWWISLIRINGLSERAANTHTYTHRMRWNKMRAIMHVDMVYLPFSLFSVSCSLLYSRCWPLPRTFACCLVSAVVYLYYCLLSLACCLLPAVSCLFVYCLLPDACSLLLCKMIPQDSNIFHYFSVPTGLFLRASRA